VANGSTRNGSILDLVFSNDRNFVPDVKVDDPFSSSDHCTVVFKVLCVTQHTPPPNVSVYDFKHADWTAITSYLNDINFYDLFAYCDSADSVVSIFYAVIYEAFNRFIPVRKVSNHRSSKYHYTFKVRRLYCIKKLQPGKFIATFALPNP
jgi:hypothetical protein